MTARITGILLSLSCALVFGLLVLPPIVSADVPVPAYNRPVVDLTGVLGATQSALESEIEHFRLTKGAQIAVLVLPSTAPEAIEQFSIRVSDAWKVGRKGVDDGVLLIVALQDRTVRIEVGRGLEGDLTDLKSHRIIDEQILPNFKKGDIPGGIRAGVSAIISVLSGTELPPPVPVSSFSEENVDRLFFAVIAAIAIGQFLKAILGSFLGFALVTPVLVAFCATIVGLPIALLIGLVAGMFIFATSNTGGRSYSSRGGGFSSGGFGGGGGGFSGGGGGGFSGGGASGRW